jgi:hypothetical protein
MRFSSWVNGLSICIFYLTIVLFVLLQCTAILINPFGIFKLFFCKMLQKYIDVYYLFLDFPNKYPFIDLVDFFLFKIIESNGF